VLGPRRRPESEPGWFDDTRFDEVVLGILQRIDVQGADSVPKDASSWDEVALPVPFKVAGVPG